MITNEVDQEIVIAMGLNAYWYAETHKADRCKDLDRFSYASKKWKESCANLETIMKRKQYKPWYKYPRRL